MSSQIVEVEAALMHCIKSMHNALLETVQDALPQSGGGAVEGEHGGELVDTMAHQLEWEHNVEQQRIDRVVDEVDRHFSALESAVKLLPDVSVASLDHDIEVLNAEATMLAQTMINTYDEAEALSALLQKEIEAQKIQSV
uniref:Uncharacterized protein n=1 Tax=Trypanosoma congolense (strain IL3000) TaxID=1068625 RepID=G0UZ65_TRYCI|nr:conserved hypothetical protein [Trypanosoma congolense IL3000]